MIGNALALDPDSFPLDRYEPISELGKGSAGIVYLCRDRLLEKRVAIKCLRTLTADQLMGFQAEAKSTSLLKHVGVVAVLDFGVTSGGAPYMVMEYAEGKTLEQRLKESGPLPTKLAIKIFLRIAEALEYAHSKGIFHRDLKSSNILILDENSANPDVRLIDFGVARLKHAIQASTLAQGTTIVGTPAYMPPDQAAGQSYDVQSEIYALGCTMFEGLTGRTPFVGETALETIAMHAHEKVPALSDVRGDIFFSEDLEWIVQTCLAKEKGDRFASMADLANALSTLDSARTLGDNSTSGRLTTSMRAPGVRPRGKLKRFAIYSLIFFACLMPALIVYMVIQPLEDKKTAEKDSSIFSEFSGLPANDPMDTGTVGRGLEHNQGEYKITDGNDDELTGLFEPQNPPVRTLYFKGGSYTGACLAKVADLPRIIGLEFVDVLINDRDFKFLSQCKNLEKLEFAHCDRITGSCLKYAEGSRNLAFIQFKGGKFSDENLKFLKNSKSIKIVSIEGCPNFTGDGFAYLPDSIERIDWLSTWSRHNDPVPIDYSEKKLGQLGRLPVLDTLVLSSDLMDDTAYGAITKLKRLRSLVLVGVKALLPRSIEILKSAPNLGRLEFREMALDPDVIEKIGVCKKVQTLSFTNCGFDEKSMAALVGLPNGVRRLLIDEPNMDKDTLLQLRKLKTLEHMILRNLPVEIGASTITKLKRELPDCTIDIKFEDGRVINVTGKNGAVDADIREFY